MGREQIHKRKAQVPCFVVFAALLVLCFASGLVESVAAQRPRSPAASRKKPTGPIKPRVDYSRFSHRTHVEQEKLACDSCHKVPSKNWKEVRVGEAAFPDVSDFPEHSSCL